MSLPRIAVAAALVAASVAGAPNAHAIGFAVGVSGGMTVENDFTVCGELHFPAGVTFVGQMTAVAEMQGPGTRVGTVRGSIPIIATTDWEGCINGAYAGATVGDGKFTLSASGLNGTSDYVEVQQCVITMGALTCA